MADKDYKDMTISVLLRHVGYTITEDCDLYRSTDVIDTLRDVLYVEEHPTHYSIDMVNILDSIANKIDVELAEARANGISEGVEASLFVAAKAWAKDNGWPDFHDGEDFGAWLERCTYKKLVDDRNEPVQFGDEIELHHRDGDVDKGRFQEVTVNRGPVWMLSFTGVDHEHLYRYDSEFDVIKRPDTEVLTAEGAPVVIGRIYFDILTGIAVTVTRITEDECGKTLVCASGDICELQFYPYQLTEKQPMLIADCRPVNVGDKVYLTCKGVQRSGIDDYMDRQPFTITKVGGEYDVTGHGSHDNIDWLFQPDWITHEPAPDSLSKIREDAEKSLQEYWGCDAADRCTLCTRMNGVRPMSYYGAHNCVVAQGLDLARRKAEFEKRTGGK